MLYESRLSPPPIVVWPDQRLTQRAQPILDFGTQRVQVLYEILVAAMEAGDGIGIAAPQIGIGEMMFVIAKDVARTSQALAFVNPALMYFGPVETDVEGCLSFPGASVEVPRYRRAVVTAHDLRGILFTVDATRLYARCLQHEFDHLLGQTLARFQ